LCKLIDSTPLITPEELPKKAIVPHITVSIGVANLWEIHGINRSIVELADEPMYEAKRLGRNCVAVVFNPIFDNEPVV